MKSLVALILLGALVASVMAKPGPMKPGGGDAPDAGARKLLRSLVKFFEGK